jgi:glycosyltransferase involved in cell wall biosynthesis
MSKPFLSLITPVYNIERLLPKTIESALEQTFTDWEMILVDDGSPDHAGRICDQYAEQDSRISVIHKKNAGLAAARNTGIKACTGKYFLIFEGSDTLVDKNTLGDICNDLRKMDVDIYFARLQDMMERNWKVTNVQAEYCVNGLYANGGKNLFKKLYDNNDILALSSPVNKVFRSAFVKEHELWFYEGIYHDDDEWIPRTITMSEKSYFTNRIIYNALTWDGCFGQTASDKSLTKKACDKMLIAQHCCEDIDRRFPEKNTEFKKKYYEYYVRMYISGITALNHVKDEACRIEIQKSIQAHEKVFQYALKCESRNLRWLARIQKIIGLTGTKKIIQMRYS